MRQRELSSLWTPRVVFAGVFLACVLLLAFALYLQHVLSLEPCPMCILQRFAFIAIAAVALVAAIHGPRASGVVVYSTLVVLLAMAGGGVAIRHAWLQRFPTPSSSCGADLDYLLDTFPLSKALPAIFAGTGACDKVEWRLLGLSIPEWTLVWFVILAAVGIWAALRVRGPKAG